MGQAWGQYRHGMVSGQVWGRPEVGFGRLAGSLQTKDLSKTEREPLLLPARTPPPFPQQPSPGSLLLLLLRFIKTPLTTRLPPSARVDQRRCGYFRTCFILALFSIRVGCLAQGFQLLVRALNSFPRNVKHRQGHGRDARALSSVPGFSVHAHVPRFPRLRVGTSVP